jgi:hypothetical protein
MTPLDPVADLTAGTSFLRWYAISLNGNPIPTDSTVTATLVSTNDQNIESEIYLGNKNLVYNATAGEAGTGAWELIYTADETRKLRQIPNKTTDNVKVLSAWIEIRPQVTGFPAFLDAITIGRSHG